MFKKLLLLPAAATTLFALLNLYSVFLNTDSGVVWRLGQGLASFVVIGIGLWTWPYVRTGHSSKTVAFLVGSALILLGFASAIMVYSNGQTTGDVEYYVFPAAAIFVGQGAYTIFTAWWGQSNHGVV